jgi:hypothetical protein
MTALQPVLAVGEEPPPLRPADRELPRTRPVAGAAPKGERRRSLRRFQCVNAFLDVTMAGLGRAELAVWLLLWRDTKPDGLARTSQADLARRVGCNPRTVRRALAGLQGAGLVEVVRQGGLRRRMSVYRVRPVAGDG